MKCYYEELGVERDANDSEIKTAYRRLALKWHPDKNLNCLEESKERFQLIQQAYEVLSDPQERAWYDNHREQILRGKNSDYEDSCLDVFQYFTVSCFKGFGDDDKGFYSIYREVFEKITVEDAEFMEDEDDLSSIPKFGDSKSSYEEVVGPFYAYWSAYCTKRTYTWLCPYDIKEIKDRRILREIEKDMKKIVQKAKKERNEEVRNLVSFIRKRDKRVQAYKKMLEERAAFNRHKQEQNRLEQIRRRQQELEEMKRNSKTANAHNDDYEEQLKQLEQQYSSDEEYYDDDDDDDDEEEFEIVGDEEEIQVELTEKDESIFDAEDEAYIDDFYCVACNKDYKTKKAFTNHQTSKKHQDNVEKLKLEMQAEENSYQNKEISNQTNEEVPSDQEAEEKDNTASDLPSKSKTAKGKNRKAEKNVKKLINLDTECQSDKEENLSNITKHISNLDLIENDGIDNNDNDDWNTSNKKSNKKSKNKSKANKNKTTLNEIQPVKQADELKNESIIHTKSTSDLESEIPQHMCVTCRSKFDSKNKLFSHLKITNHGVYIPKKTSITNDDTKSKKSKAKRK